MYIEAACVLFSALFEMSYVPYFKADLVLLSFRSLALFHSWFASRSRGTSPETLSQSDVFPVFASFTVTQSTSETIKWMLTTLRFSSGGLAGAIGERTGRVDFVFCNDKQRRRATEPGARAGGWISHVCLYNECLYVRGS